MPPVGYPPRPTDKQYPFHPQVPSRGVPLVPDPPELISANVAQQPDVRSGRTSEVVSAPKRIEFGVMDVWVQVGLTRSRGYDDGISVPLEDERIRDLLCFAPGVDDQGTSEGDKMRIGWQVHGLGHIQSAKLEVFCRDQKEPIWERHWGNAWGKEEAAIGDFPAVQKDYIHEGYLDWSEVAVKTGALPGEEAAAFPDGLLTVARSPYQVRLTVSGCGAENDPPDGDQFAYPMVGWTFVHVALHSISLELGEETWLGKDRPDIAEEYRELVVGTRADKEGQIDYGLEGETLLALRRSGTRFRRGEHQPLFLRSDLYAKGGVDHEYYGKMWGDGPRIPLVATPRVRTLSGDATDVNLVKVCKGVKLLWDWTDGGEARYGNPVKPEHTMGRGKTSLGDGTLSQEFFKNVYELNKDKGPKGSANCPATANGKLGAPDQHVLLHQEAAGDGNGSLPFASKRCANRTWAVWTELDQDGKAGVMFQPSRMGGDQYTIAVYHFHDPAMDGGEPISPVTAQGCTGTFEVFRRLTMHHKVIGDLPETKEPPPAPQTIDLVAIKDVISSRMKRMANVDIDWKTEVLTSERYVELMELALQKARESYDIYLNRPFYPLAIPFMVDASGHPGPQMIKVRAHGAYVTAVEDLFRGGKIRALTDLGKPPAPKDDETNAERLFRMDMCKGALQHERLLSGDKSVHAYQLQELDPVKVTEYEDRGGKDEKAVEKVLRPLVRLVLFPAGSEPFAADAKVKGEATQVERTVAYHEGKKSCWGVTWTVEQGASDSTVEVTLPGAAQPVPLKFKTPRFSFSGPTKLDAEQKKALRDALVTAVDSFADESQAFPVKIKGKTRSTAGNKRVESVKAHVRQLLDDELLLIDRKAVWEQFKEKSSYLAKPEEFISLWATSGPILYPFIDAVVEKDKIERGTILIHYSRATNVNDHQTSLGVGKIKQDVYGGEYNSVYREPDRGLATIKLSTPDSAAPHTYKGYAKESISVILHEIGHTLFLPHSPPMKGRTTKPAVEGVKEVHVAGEGCIMDYDEATHHFCAMCVLRMRGWKWTEFSRSGKREGSASISMNLKGELLEPLYPEPFATDVGKAARLQVLGLFNRPLSWATDPDHQDEFAECVQFAIAHARAIDADTVRDAASLGSKVTSYLFGGKSVKAGGQFPMVGAQAKLRVPGVLTGIYSNSDIEVRHKKYGKKLSGDFPEEVFSQESDRFALLEKFFEDNPALGVFPLELQVKSTAGNRALAEVEVQITIVAPDAPEAFKLEEARFAEQPFGGVSLGCANGRPDLHAEVKEWLEANVDKHEEGADTDPQHGNVHVSLGGKRGLWDDGDVQTPGVGPNGFIDNLFAAVPGDQPLKPARDTSGKIIQHGFMVKTDDEGRARFYLKPSRVAGDRYKLKIEVIDPAYDGSRLLVEETGTITVWHPMRFSRYLKMPGVTKKDEIPSAVRSFMPDAAAYVGEVKDLDLGHLTTELARSHVELIIEKPAQTAEPFAQKHWDDFKNELAALRTDYPEVINVTSHSVNTPIEIQLKRQSDKKTFKGTFQGAPVPDTVYVRPGKFEPDVNKYIDLAPAFAHDFETDHAGDLGSLARPAAGDPVCGLTGFKKSGAAGDIDVDRAKTFVNYRTGEIQVTFTAQHDGEVCAGSHLSEPLDLTKLLYFPDKSPFLFNVTAPAAYNKGVKNRINMATAWAANWSSKFLAGNTWGLVPLAMIKAMHRSIGGNKQSYYPGIVMFHGFRLDMYSEVLGNKLEGKGFGNGVMMVSADNDEATVKNLFVHEVSHAIGLMHNFGSGGARHVQGKKCVMSYDKPSEQHGGHCAKCVAYLRGIRVLDGPLKDK